MTVEPALESASSATVLDRPPETALVAVQPGWTWRGPSPRDPRLQVAAVLLSLQVLGQTVIDFDLSIAQILIAIGTCAVLEVTITAVRSRTVAWPASAMLTGNGVALLLRVPGTEHGDWWSTRGGWIFAGTAAGSLLSKYVIRWRGRHIFNPSNLGLAVCFLVLGSSRVDPQDLWWGPLSPGIVAVLVLITFGGLMVPRRLGLLPLAAAFWFPFTLFIGVLAATGHAMDARWHYGPVAGWTYWSVLSFSPEILVFLFFMITDPKTVPGSRRGRVLFGAFVGVSAALIVSFQTTEYATKVGILVALVLACAVRFAIVAWPALAPRLLVPTRPLPTALGVVAVLAVTAATSVALSAATRDDAASAATSSYAGELPPIEIDPTVRREVSGLDEETARAMVGDLLAGLENEAEAVRTGQPDLLDRSTVAGRLEDLRAAARATRPGDPVTVAVHRPSAATVVVAAPRPSPQALPTLGVRLEGEVVATTWLGEQTIDEQSSPLDETFVLLPGADGYRIAGTRSSGADAVETRTISTDDVLRDLSLGSAIDEGSQPGQVDLFTDVTDAAGVRIDTTALRVDRLPEPVEGYWENLSTFDLINASQRYFAAGQAWGDVDGDGHLDLFLTDQGGPNHLFLGTGDGSFRPAPASMETPLRIPEGGSGGASFVDYDNSGRPSLLVLTDAGPRLFRNEDGSTFEDVTKASGLIDGGKGQTASWADFDDDGDLDVYLANYGCQPCTLQNRPPYDLGQGKLFRNRGDGTFEDRTDLLEGIEGIAAMSFVAVWLDADDDGDLDLLVANDIRGSDLTDAPSELTPGNVLVRNDGPGCDGWCFRDATAAWGAGLRGDYMGAAVGDFSNSGRPEVFLTNTGIVQGPAALLRNDGTSFEDVAGARGADLGEYAWGASPIDVDLDGRVDVYVPVGFSDALHMLPVREARAVGDAVVDARTRILSGQAGLPSEAIRPPYPVADDPDRRTDNNRVLLQQPDGSFEVHVVGDTDALPAPHYTSAVADFDGDGWPDVVTGTMGAGYALLRNSGATGTGHHRLALRLHGDGETVNRDAVGARVQVRGSDGVVRTGWVQIGGGLGGGSDTEVLLGLGDATAEEVMVTWPDGTRTTIADPPTDQRGTLRYGDPEPTWERFATGR